MSWATVCKESESLPAGTACREFQGELRRDLANNLDKWSKELVEGCPHWQQVVGNWPPWPHVD